jgi:hypothetical protein
MPTLYVPDYVQVEIDGVDKTEYVVNYERQSSLCEIGDSFNLELSSEYTGSLEPYDPIIIKEGYGTTPTRVLRGYIVEITQGVEPGSYLVTGGDKSVLLFDYFISEQIVAGGETVDYWINYMANLVGLGITFESTSPARVEDQTPLGFQTVGEAIIMLERKAAYYVKYDSAVDKLRVFRPSTSQPQMTINEALSADRSLSTEKTRNVVKVYGGFRYNLVTQESEQVFSSARTDIDELITDKTIVVANPAVTRQTHASIIANRILNVTNSIDDVQVFQIDGFYPSIQPGDTADINWSSGWNYDGTRIITSVDSSVGQDGAITTITIGEKCPRLSISLPPSPVFVSTISGGVGVSWDGGDNFYPSNTGLTVAKAMDVSSIAVNSYGQSMIITRDGVYKRPYFTGTWTSVGDLPDPVNTEGHPAPLEYTDLGLLRVVDAPTVYGRFHILASGVVPYNTYSGGILRSRGWVYTTNDFGITWSSMQLFVPPSGWPAVQPSGGNYHVVPFDIHTSEDNNSYVLMKGETEVIIDLPLLSVYWIEINTNDRIIGGWWDGEDIGEFDNPYKLNLNAVLGDSNNIFDAKIWSVPSNREIAYMAVMHNDITLTHSNRAVCEVWRTNDNGDSWTKIHDANFYSSSDNGFYQQYSMAFDPSSTSTSAKICFMGVEELFIGGEASFQFYSRVVDDNPTSESTSYSDSNTKITAVDGEDYNIGDDVDDLEGKHAIDYTGKCYAALGWWRVENIEGVNTLFTRGTVVSVNFSTNTITHELTSDELSTTSYGVGNNTSSILSTRSGNVYWEDRSGYYQDGTFISSESGGIPLPGFGTTYPVGMRETANTGSIGELELYYPNGSTQLFYISDPLDDDYGEYLENMTWTVYPFEEGNSYDYVYVPGDPIDRDGGLHKTLDFQNYTNTFGELYREPGTGYGGYGLHDFDYRSFGDA